MMSKFSVALVLAMATAAALCTPACSGRAAPAPEQASKEVDCSTVVYGMTDCLDFASPGSNASKPSKTCCEGIQQVVQLSPSCLCEAMKEGADMGVVVDMNRALDLPVACKISVPDLGNCSSALSPSEAQALTSPMSPWPLQIPQFPAQPPSSPDEPGSPSEQPTETPRATAPSPPASGSLSLMSNPITLMICQLAVATCFYV